MRKVFAGMAAIGLVAALGVPAAAAVETVTGKLVDQACYLKDAKNADASHLACMQKCAKEGLAVALVTADGKVYTVQGGLAAKNNAGMVGHMSHTVSITGDVTAKDGKNFITADALKMVSAK
jgi:hypothetical protein